VPIGFVTWWADLEAVADNGLAELEAMWKKSPTPLKQYLLAHHAAKWDALKTRAKKVKPTAAPGRAAPEGG
jgi:hypothetical protein